MANDNLTNEEIKLEILRIVKETGTEYQKKTPCLFVKIIINGLKVRQFERTLLTRRNRL